MQVKIYKPSKSVMQSGNGQNQWLIEFPRPSHSKFQEKLLLRVSSSDTTKQIKLFFPTKEAAIAFAQSQSYTYELIESAPCTMAKKSYAANFQ